MKKPYWITLVVLSLAGLIDSVYLTGIKWLSLPGCIGNGCDTVLASSFSTVLNVPISIFGAIAYVTVLILLLRAYKNPSHNGYKIGILGVSLVGTGISIFLLSVQAFQLQQWCLFCVGSALIMSLIFILALLSQKKWAALFSNTHTVYMPIITTIVLSSMSILGLYFGIHYYTGGGDAHYASLQSTDVVAQFSGRKVTLGELDRLLGVKGTQLKRSIYDARLAKLGDLLLDYDAKKKGVSREQLTAIIIKKSSSSVSDADIKKFYTDKKGQLGNATFDTIKGRIKEFLTHQKSTLIIKEYVETLKKTVQFQVFIPRSFHVKLNNNPKQIVHVGPKNASLVIDIFSDFECPHCKITHHQLDKLYHQYPNDIRINFRQFPLKGHSGARLKALAALCSDQQDKYLKYSTKIYANLSPLNKYQLADYAKDLGLNIPSFNHCLSSSETEKILVHDIAEGTRLSLTSTPSLFFNGEYFLRFPDKVELNQLLKRVKIIN
jgi:uncharacterized membrane protein